MKIFYNLDEERNVCAVSTIQTSATPLSAESEGILDLSKLQGLMIENGELTYSEELLEAKAKAKADAEAKAQAEKQLEYFEAEKRLEGLDDDQALECKALFPLWTPGIKVKKGKRLLYDDKLWKVRQDHPTQEGFPPSTDTASLYERIELDHAGTAQDPIPYDQNMAVLAGKYYVENGVTYKATRDSGNPLYNTCASLVGIYFEIVEEE